MVAQAAQDREAVHAGHAPIQQDGVGAAAVGEVPQHRLAVAEVVDLVAALGEVEAERFAEQGIVVDDDHPLSGFDGRLAADRQVPCINCARH